MKKAENSALGRALFTLAALVVMIVVAVLIFGKMGNETENTQAELVRRSVRRALTTCYATEGAYPMSLDYLKQNYDLTYNEERFYVFYDAFASNVMPEIRVSLRGRDDG